MIVILIGVFPRAIVPYRSFTKRRFQAIVGNMIDRSQLEFHRPCADKDAVTPSDRLCC
jgi:hypothetical protein